MPCVDDRTGSELVAEARRAFRHNSDVAEMLCTTCKTIEAEGKLDRLDPATKAWWAEHKKHDAAQNAFNAARGGMRL